MEDIIENYPKLKFKEAKKLNELMLSNTGEERKKIREELIKGTLYIVCKFVKDSGFSDIKTSYYDSDDIFSESCEAWIKVIDSGRLINAQGYSGIIYSGTFYNLIIEHLVNSQNYYTDNPLLSKDNFGYFFKLYLEINKEKNDVKEEDIINLLKNEYVTLENIKEFIDISNNILVLLNSRVNNLSVSKLLYLRDLLIELSYVDKKCNMNEIYDEEFDEKILYGLVMQSFKEDLALNLKDVFNDNEIYVFNKRINIDEPETLRKISEKINLCYQRVAEIEQKCRIKIKGQRFRNRLYKYKNDIY